MAYSDQQAAQALVSTIGDSRWEAVSLARGWLAMIGGEPDDKAARVIYERGSHTLRRSRELAPKLREQGLLALLTPRERTGSAENPITKLFPATITEQRFLELLDDLCGVRPGISYTDDRQTSRSLTDFTLQEQGQTLPVNVKNAGARFQLARDLVGLDPDDCVPIPAYKASLALERVPNLLYVVAIDYELVGKLATFLPQAFTPEEAIVWDLLNRYVGTRNRDAEDTFIWEIVRRHWERIKAIIADSPFQVISARKAMRILQTQPKRTPGIGVPTWGTSARGEVNVHVSPREEMTPWIVVRDRIVAGGIADVVGAVNRRRTEEVYDPEI